MTTVAVTNTEFLEVLCEDLPDGAAAMVVSLPGDPYAAPRAAWFARPWSFAVAPPVRPTWNNYVAIASVYADPELGEYRRRKANLARLLAVMVDDLGTKVAMHQIDQLAPSAMIETSPDNYQAFYFLKPCAITDSTERATHLIDVMISQGLTTDTDPGMSGCVRLARLPVGINGKQKYLQDGRPFHVRLAGWSPGTRYTVEDVAHAFALDLTPPQPRLTAPTVDLQTAHRQIDDFAAMLEVLTAAGYYQAPLGEGRHAISCPWINEHSDRCDTGTAIFEPNSDNKWLGGFRCHHAHGKRLHIGHVYRFVRDLTRGAS